MDTVQPELYGISLKNLFSAQCQSKNHRVPEDCYGDIWECAKCHKTFCYNDGCHDKYYELCDDCANEAAELEEKK